MKKNSTYALLLCAFATCSAEVETTGTVTMKKNITTLVIPAAGLGTRFLPLTKSVAKEMVTLPGAKPAINYIIEEGVSAGITNFVLVVSEGKESIRHYFSDDQQLHTILAEKNKEQLIAPLEQLIERSKFSFVNQTEQLGLGHAILTAQEAVGNNFFAISLPDMISPTPELDELIKIAHEQNASVIAVQEVPRERVSSYGVISIKNTLNDRLFEIADLVEKPKVADAPSNLAIVGRYVLSPTVFKSLQEIKPGAQGEYQLTDALVDLIKNKGEKIFAYVIKNNLYDVGIPSGWLQAVIELSLNNPETAELVRSSVANHKKPAQ